MNNNYQEKPYVRVAVLVSGGGTNLQALIDAERAGALHSGRICLVVSDRNDAYALERARIAGIESAIVVWKDCPDAHTFEQRLHQLLEENGIDLIVLAGFMRILSPAFTSAGRARQSRQGTSGRRTVSPAGASAESSESAWRRQRRLRLPPRSGWHTARQAPKAS